MDLATAVLADGKFGINN